MSQYPPPHDRVLPATTGPGSGTPETDEILERLRGAEEAVKQATVDVANPGAAYSAAPSSTSSTSSTANPWAGQRLESQQFTMLWHPLLTAIANAPDRRVAAEQCVAIISQMLPDHTIRLGWAVARPIARPIGGQRDGWKLDRLYDSRLGWLGQDNSVYQALSLGFAKASEDVEAIRWESANLLLELRDVGPVISRSAGDATAVEDSSAVEGESTPGQSKSGQSKSSQSKSGQSGLSHRKSFENRAVVWIRPPQSKEEELQQFQRILPKSLLSTMAAVFFSRPLSGRWEQVHNGVRRWWSKRLSLGMGALLLVLIACVPTDYRVDGTATVTAKNARRVAAPIDATLLIAHKRPGDLVTAGEPLLELDGRPLRIELEALTAEIDETSKDEDIALAKGEIATAQLAGLRRRTLSRRRDLIIDRLDKLIVTSPIEGIVIQGDLQHSLGTPLEIGQTLLEIAPRDSVEIELEIPEVEIGYVHADSAVRFWFPALGEVDFQSHIETVYPSATIREDRNVFIAKTPMPVSGMVDREDRGGENDGGGSAVGTPLRVGMRGEAVVVGPMRPWLWKWVRLPIRRLGWIVGW